MKREMDKPMKHIDRAVRDASGYFEATPPAGMWAHLERSLNSNTRAGVVSFRRTVLSAAAVVLAFIGGYFLAMMVPSDISDGMPGYSPRIAYSASDIAGMEESEGLEDFLLEASVVSASTGLASKPGVGGFKETTINNLATVTLPTAETDAAMPLLTAHLTATILPELNHIEHLPATDRSLPPQRIALPATLPHQLPDIIPSPHRATLPRWSVAGVAGQTIANYYQSSAMPVSEGVYRHDLMSSTKEQILSPLLSWGVSVQYRVTERAGISTGLAFHQFSTPLINPVAAEFTLMSNDNTVGNPIGPVELGQETVKSLQKSPGQEVNTGDFAQHFTYMEVPLTATWRVSFSRIGIGIRGGIGSNILSGNNVLHTTEDEQHIVGTTAGVRPVYFSGIVGADISLRLDDQWSWSFLPVYRHALHPVSKSPYDPRIVSFGLYTGLQFRF